MKSPWTKKGEIAAVLLLLVISFALYKPLFFIGEDISLITTSEDLDNFEVFRRIWGQSLIGESGSGGLYRPLALLSYHIERTVWGLKPGGYYFVNIFLNTICVLFLFYIALELFKEPIYALLTALLFLFHPAHPATIYWISARADLLCTAFYLAGLFLSIRYVLKPENSYLVFGGISFLIAIFSKEMAISAPVVAPIIAYAIADKREKKPLIAVFLVSFVPILIYVAIRISVLGPQLATDESYYLPSFGYFFINIAKAVGFLLVPFGHSAAERFLFANKSIFLAITVLVVAFFIGGLFLLSKRDRRIPLLLIAPAISIIPVIGMTMRWQIYLPSSLMVLFIVYLLSRIMKRPHTIAVYSIFLLLFGAGFFALRWRMVKSSRLARELVDKGKAVLEENNDAGSFVFFLLPSKIYRSATYTNGFVPTLQRIAGDDRFILEMLPSVHYGDYHSCKYEMDGEFLIASFDSSDDYIAPRVRSYLIGEEKFSPEEKITTQDGLELEIRAMNELGRISKATLDLRQEIFPEDSRAFIFADKEWKRLHFPDKSENE